MDSERAIASIADVQRLLLPDNPRIRGLNYAFHYQPAAVAAGDYYDLMPLNDGVPAAFLDQAGVDAWGVMLADVSGHGPAAAMEAVQFDAILRTYQGGYRKFNRPFLRVWRVGSGRASAALGTDRAQIGGSCVGFRHRGATQRLSA